MDRAAFLRIYGWAFKENQNILKLSRRNILPYLGFEKAANGAMRLCSPELAKELMDKIHCEQGGQMALPDM